MNVPLAKERSRQGRSSAPRENSSHVAASHKASVQTTAPYGDTDTEQENVESTEDDELSSEKVNHDEDTSQTINVAESRCSIRYSSFGESTETAEEDELSVERISHVDKSRADAVAESEAIIQDSTPVVAIESAKEDKLSECKIRHVGDESQAVAPARPNSTHLDNSPAETIESAKEDDAESKSTSQDVNYTEDEDSTPLFAFKPDVTTVSCNRPKRRRKAITRFNPQVRPNTSNCKIGEGF